MCASFASLYCCAYFMKAYGIYILKIGISCCSIVCVELVVDISNTLYLAFPSFLVHG